MVTRKLSVREIKKLRKHIHLVTIEELTSKNSKIRVLAEKQMSLNAGIFYAVDVLLGRV